MPFTFAVFRRSASRCCCVVAHDLVGVPPSLCVMLHQQCNKKPEYIHFNPVKAA
jgi:hypothetical protein